MIDNQTKYYSDMGERLQAAATARRRKEIAERFLSAVSQFMGTAWQDPTNVGLNPLDRATATFLLEVEQEKAREAR